MVREGVTYLKVVYLLLSSTKNDKLLEFYQIDNNYRIIIKVSDKEITRKIEYLEFPYVDFLCERLDGININYIISITESYADRPDLALAILLKKFAGCGNPW